MSALGAAGWTLAATVLFLWLIGLTLTLRPGAERDVVNAFGCQALAYLIVLFLILRVHAPEVSIRALVGLRRTSLAAYPLAALLGVAIGLPANFLYAKTIERWPRAIEDGGIAATFADADPAKRAVIGLVVVALGPLLEELFFRGALLRPLRARHGVAAAVALSGVYFGLAHAEWQSQLPIALVGVAMAVVRQWSGALGPAIAMHCAFNAVGLVQLLVAPRLDLLDAPPIPLVAGGLAVSAALLFGIRQATARSPAAQAARQRDLEEV
jgi:membrane protease YdiL (CAAX protease family)